MVTIEYSDSSKTLIQKVLNPHFIPIQGDYIAVSGEARQVVSRLYDLKSETLFIQIGEVLVKGT